MEGRSVDVGESVRGLMGAWRGCGAGKVTRAMRTSTCAVRDRDAGLSASIDVRSADAYSTIWEEALAANVSVRNVEGQLCQTPASLRDVTTTAART